MKLLSYGTLSDTDPRLKRIYKRGEELEELKRKAEALKAKCSQGTSDALMGGSPGRRLHGYPTSYGYGYAGTASNGNRKRKVTSCDMDGLLDDYGLSKLFDEKLGSELEPKDEPEGVIASRTKWPTRSLADTYPTTFHKFAELPPELQDRIYGFVLVTDKPIAPKLCTHSGDKIQFHDENQAAHDAIYNRLAITRVSRAVRSASLLVFYAQNTFDFCADLVTYLNHLAFMGRFHMVHRITFPLKFQKSDRVVDKMLRGIHKVLYQCEKYRATQWEKPYNRKSLIHDPVYTAGGLEWYGIFLLLLRLSAPTPSGPQDRGEGFTREIVLYLPRKDVFDMYVSFAYFFDVTARLGINLKFVEGAPVVWVGDCLGLQLEWRRRFQGQTQMPTPASACEVAGASAPGLPAGLLGEIKEKMRRVYETTSAPPSKRTVYARRPCKREPEGPELLWFAFDVSEVTADEVE
jgi:hypothetical protein